MSSYLNITTGECISGPCQLYSSLSMIRIYLLIAAIASVLAICFAIVMNYKSKKKTPEVEE